MATSTAATVVKFNAALRRSTLHETAVFLQEKAWVQETVEGLARGGKSLLDFVARSTCGNAQAAVDTGVATGLAVGNVALHRSKSVGIIRDDPLESVVANLVARRNHSQGHRGSTLQLAQAVDIDLDLEGSRRQSVVAKISHMELVSDEDYRWETDPNGGWLASFP